MNKYTKLEENIIDTAKDYQLKIGYITGKMNLYYVRESICSLLSIDKSLDDDVILQMLKREEILKSIGGVHITYDGSRYRVELSAKVNKYIYDNVEATPFQKDFIESMKSRKITIEDVRRVFLKYSKEYIEEDMTCCELGNVFYFRDESIDRYVYCIEFDEFGAVYHRFTKEDYRQML